MTDGGYGLPRIEELLHELDRLLIGPQLIRVHYAAGKQERIKILGRSPLKRHINRQFVPPIGMLPALHLALLRRNNGSLGSGLYKSVPWTG